MESAKPQTMEIYHAYVQLDGLEHDVKLVSCFPLKIKIVYDRNYKNKQTFFLSKFG